jgi:hypothetical protein
VSAVLADQAVPPSATVVAEAPVQHRNTRLVSWFAASALIPMIAAHVIGAAVVDPVLDPISWYAFVPGGGEMIIAGSCLLAVLGLVLTVRMYQAKLAVGPTPAVAMIIFAAAMIMVGVFPTDPPDTAVTLSATIHRICAGAAFVVLPLVGIALDRSVAKPSSPFPSLLRKAALLLGGLVAIFLAIHLPLAMSGSGIAAFGLLERAGFAIMIGYLFLLAATIDRESPSVRRQTSSQAVGASPSSDSAALESIA